MTIQYLLIALVFMLALGYLLKFLRRLFTQKDGCSKGCGCEGDKKKSI